GGRSTGGQPLRPIQFGVCVVLHEYGTATVQKGARGCDLDGRGDGQPSSAYRIATRASGSIVGFGDGTACQEGGGTSGVCQGRGGGTPRDRGTDCPRGGSTGTLREETQTGPPAIVEVSEAERIAD